METIQVRVWQVVFAAALATLMVGIAVGRYVVPAGKQPGQAVDLGNGVTVYVPKNAEPPIRERRETSAAQADIRAAIPAIEAFSRDHGGYVGISLAGLRRYDPSLHDSLVIAYATASTYCIQRSVGSTTYRKDGPGADIVAGPCPRR